MEIIETSNNYKKDNIVRLITIPVTEHYYNKFRNLIYLKTLSNIIIIKYDILEGFENCWISTLSNNFQIDGTFSVSFFYEKEMTSENYEFKVLLRKRKILTTNLGQ